MSNHHNNTPPADILVVDDDPESLRLLVQLLSQAGFKVRPARDGQQALSAARLASPDLILLDVLMPDMTGYEVCEALKTDEATRDIPIIFLSGLNQVFDKVKAFSTGGVDYISKPYQNDEVLARIRTHLTLHQLQKKLQQRNTELQQEIAAREWMELRLRESEERYRSVVEDQTEVIARMRADGTLTFVNDFFCRFFDKPRSELEGQQWQPWAVAEDVAEIEARLSTLSPTNPVVVIENRVYSGGEIRWMQFINRGFFDDQGQLVEIQGVGRDITERRQTELLLQEANDTLQQRVLELTIIHLIGQTLSTVTDIQTALEAVVHLVNLLFNASGTTVSIANPVSKDIEIITSHTLQRLDFSKQLPVTEADGGPDEQAVALPLSLFIGRLLKERQTLSISKVQSGPALSSVQHSFQAPNIQEYLFVPLHVRGEVIGLLALATDRPDREFTSVDEHLAETIADQIAGAVKITQLFGQEHRQHQLAESLRQVAAVLSSTLDRETILRVIFEQLQQVLPYDGGKIGLISGEELVIVQTVGHTFWQVDDRIPLKSEIPLTQILQQREVFILASEAEVELWPSWTGAKEPSSWMLAPLDVGRTIFGLLAIRRDQVGAFGQEDADIFRTFANHAALAIENARLYAQAQTMAVDAERQRLARELHDSVTQSLYSLTLFTGGWIAMAQRGESNTLQMIEQFKQLEEISIRGLREMRLLLHQLRPPILEEVGLVGALQQRLDAVEQRVKIRTRLLVHGALDDVPLTVAEQLFAIAQEALTNILRHAEATEVMVLLRRENGHLTLSVTDNGMGFDPNVPSFGLGLASIRERTEAMGGQVEITSAALQGTTVMITIDLIPEERV